MMKTNCVRKTLAILLCVLLATPTFLLSTFAEGDGFTKLVNYSTSCEPGDQWIDRYDLSTATGTNAYKSATFYLSEDGNTLKIEYTVDGETVTELHDRATDAEYFDYLHTLPAFGDPLPTSEEGLADGDYWFNLDGFIALLDSTGNLTEESRAVYESATFRMSTDGTMLRMTTHPVQGSDDASYMDDFFAEPSILCGFRRQVGVDPNAGFNLLPTSDEGLEDGDYWFDLASFLTLIKDDESTQQIYANAQYYLSDDGNTLRISVGTTLDFARDDEEGATFFSYVRQVGVDPNAGFTLLPTSEDGLEDGAYWFDAAGLAEDAGMEELLTAQYYLSDDGNTIRLITPSLGQIDAARDSDTGELLFPHLRQADVDPNAIPGFILLPTSDEGLEDGDYWYDAALAAEVSGHEDYLTFLYYLSDDGNTLRIKIGSYSQDILKTDEYASVYFGYLRQVGVDPYPGFTVLPKSADGLADGAYWYDAAGFAAMTNSESYLHAMYLLSDDGNTLRINQSGYTYDITRDDAYAGTYFVYLHKVGEVYTVLPTSEDGLEDGTYWFDAAGFAADVMDDEAYLTATYSLNEEAGVLCIVLNGEAAYYMNDVQYSYFFRYLKQAGVDPNEGFTALPTSDEGLEFGDWWYDAAGLAALEGITDEELPEFFAALECYRSDDGATLRLIYEGYVMDFPVDSEDEAEIVALLKQATPGFTLLPTSEDGLADGDLWYDLDTLNVAADNYFSGAQVFLSEDGTALRILLNGSMFDYTRETEEGASLFTLLREVGVDPNEGFTQLPTSADGLAFGDLWYDAAALAAAVEDDMALDLIYYLSDDGTTLRLDYHGMTSDILLDSGDGELYVSFIKRVTVDPTTGVAYTQLPTSDDGLADGDVWYDLDTLNIAAEGYFVDGTVYLSEDGTTLRFVLERGTYDYTQETEEGASLFMFLREVGVDPNAGFTQLPVSDEGLEIGDVWFDAAALAAALEDDMYLGLDYYLSDDGTTLRAIYYGMTYDFALDTEEGAAYAVYIKRVSGETGTAYVKLTAPDAPVAPGSTVTVTVDLRQNPGLSGMTLSLSYDTSVLTLTDVQAEGMLATGNFVAGGDLNAMPYNILWDDATAHESHTETGAILTLTFTVKEGTPAGETTVTVTYDAESTFDVDLQNVPLIVLSAATVKTYLPGDVDGDGEVDLVDVAVLTRFLAGGWDVSVVDKHCDVNADGVIDLKDVVLIRRYLAEGWDVTLV